MLSQYKLLKLSQYKLLKCFNQSIGMTVSPWIRLIKASMNRDTIFSSSHFVTDSFLGLFVEIRSFSLWNLIARSFVIGLKHFLSVSHLFISDKRNLLYLSYYKRVLIKYKYLNQIWKYLLTFLFIWNLWFGYL